MGSKVYILFHDDDWNEIHYVRGVYSTREKAEEALKNALDNAADYLRKDLMLCLNVQERTLDTELL